jgi:SprT protein
MSSAPPLGQAEQLHLDFTSHQPQLLPRSTEPSAAATPPAPQDTDDEEPDYPEDLSQIEFTPQAELTAQCQELLKGLGIPDGADKVKVEWNTRLSSTAGYASYPSWRIELNPRLAAYSGQVERTLRHELAHLIAYHRAGRTRIEPHGTEWRQACADLGIPGESVHHRLPFPRRQQRKRYAYQCPQCLVILYRVRLFSRDTACLNCCRKHAGGNYDARFRLNRVIVVHGSS